MNKNSLRPFSFNLMKGPHFTCRFIDLYSWGRGLVLMEAFCVCPWGGGDFGEKNDSGKLIFEIYSICVHTAQSAESHMKEYHRYWLCLCHALILISNVRTSASTKINWTALN